MSKSTNRQAVTRRSDAGRTKIWYRLAYLLIIIGLMSMTAYAAAPYPDVPKGKGDQCVEDTEFMRSNHMELLLHQRDETMYRGIRTKKHSLKNCMECHVVTDELNQPVSAANPKHFCRVCHDYASVSIDCFQCHASKPRPKQSN